MSVLKELTATSEGRREGRTEGAGRDSAKSTLERGVGEKESLAKDLQKSLGEEKLKAGSHSKRLRCACGASAVSARCVADSTWKRRHAVSRPTRFLAVVASSSEMPRQPRR